MECEYYDTTKKTNISRQYIVHLQQRVQQLEAELANATLETGEGDGEDNFDELARGSGAVHLLESADAKFLGPSSGIAITRIVMQLAKSYAGAQHISEIVSHAAAQQVKDRYAQEEMKPTSKIFPLISSVAADKLLNKAIIDQLVELYKLRGKRASDCSLKKGFVTSLCTNSATHVPSLP